MAMIIVLYSINFVINCVWNEGNRRLVEVRGQCVGTGSVPPCGFRVFKLGYQGWWRARPSTVPSFYSVVKSVFMFILCVLVFWLQVCPVPCVCLVL